MCDFQYISEKLITGVHFSPSAIFVLALRDTLLFVLSLWMSLESSLMILLSAFKWNGRSIWDTAGISCSDSKQYRSCALRAAAVLCISIVVSQLLCVLNVSSFGYCKHAACESV